MSNIIETIDLVKKPSGRCRCKICGEMVKENQIEFPINCWKGNLQYGKVHRNCFLKNIIKVLNLTPKELKDFRKEVILENLEGGN